MKRILAALPASAALAALVLALSPNASAKGAYTCTGLVNSTTIDQNVVVPDGATCVLLSTTVNGNVSVGSDSAAFVVRSTVNGNVSVGSGSVVDVTVFSTLNGNYSAIDANSTLGFTRFAKNVTITGGTYGISFDIIGKNLTCDGGATGTGAGNFIGGHNSGCNA